MEFLTILVLATFGLLVPAIATFVWTHRMVPGASWLAALMVASGVATLGFALELTGPSLDLMKGALRFQYLGLVAIPSVLLLFYFEFTGRPHRWGRLLLGGVSAAFLALVLTEDLHPWFHGQWGTEAVGSLRKLTFAKGPVYWAFVGFYVFSGMVATVGLLVFAWGAPLVPRRQALVLSGGTSLPLVVGAAFQVGALPTPLDPLPFALVVSGLLTSWALVRLGMVELVPAARERAIDALKDALVVVDRKGLVSDWNPAAQSFFGHQSLVRGERPLGTLGRLLEGPSPLQTSLTDVGGPRSVEGESFPVLGSRGTPVGTCWVFRDTSRQAELIAQLRSQANRDALTGLLNRRSFFDQGERLFLSSRDEGKVLTTMLIDLDHFKAINDTWGHQDGDAALVAVANCLRATLRDSDLLARYGGEEFVVLITGADAETSCRVAYRVVEAVRGCRPAGPRLTASCGVYCAVPSATDSIDVFVKRSDEALYAAKAAGRDQMCLWSPQGLARF